MALTNIFIFILLVNLITSQIIYPLFTNSTESSPKLFNKSLRSNSLTSLLKKPQLTIFKNPSTIAFLNKKYLSSSFDFLFSSENKKNLKNSNVSPKKLNKIKKYQHIPLFVPIKSSTSSFDKMNTWNKLLDYNSFLTTKTTLPVFILNKNLPIKFTNNQFDNPLMDFNQTNFFKNSKYNLYTDFKPIVTDSYLNQFKPKKEYIQSDYYIEKNNFSPKKNSNQIDKNYLNQFDHNDKKKILNLIDLSKSSNNYDDYNLRKNFVVNKEVSSKINFSSNDHNEKKFVPNYQKPNHQPIQQQSIKQEQIIKFKPTNAYSDQKKNINSPKLKLIDYSDNKVIDEFTKALENIDFRSITNHHVLELPNFDLNGKIQDENKNNDDQKFFENFDRKSNFEKKENNENQVFNYVQSDKIKKNKKAKSPVLEYFNVNDCAKQRKLRIKNHQTNYYENEKNKFQNSIPLNSFVNFDDQNERIDEVDKNKYKKKINTVYNDTKKIEENNLGKKSFQQNFDSDMSETKNDDYSDTKNLDSLDPKKLNLKIIHLPISVLKRLVDEERK